MWLKSEIKCLLGLNGSLSKSGKTPIYNLIFAKNDTELLFNKMYYKENLPFLDRKYRKLKSFIKISADVLELVDRQA